VVFNPSLRRVPLPRPGRDSGRARLAQILRVDHAGELGAVHIYRGQQAVFGGSTAHIAITSELCEMEGHEAEHLKAFDAILNDRAVRPSLLAPFWRAAGLALGVGTALLGEKAAHACTEAVESVIEDHYAGQIAELRHSEPALAANLIKFRDDELAHRDHAVDAGAKDAPGYPLLAAAIRAGCKLAIKVSQKL